MCCWHLEQSVDRKESFMLEQYASMNQKGKKVLMCIAIAVGIYFTFRFLLPLVLPFVIAGIVSIIYYPLLRKCFRNLESWAGKKKKLLLAFSVTFLYLVILLLLFGMGCYLVNQGQSVMLNFPFYQAKFIYLIKSCCCQVDALLHIQDGVSFAYIEDMAGNVWMDPMSGMLPKVTSYSVQMARQLFQLFFEVLITVIATFFMIQDYEHIREKMLQTEWGRNICGVITKCKEALKTYIKAQGLIMILDGALCTLAFWVINQPYYLMLGPLVAIVDALPVLGAGLILIPYIIILLFMKELSKAGILFLAYLGCLLIRQITEPKMIGSKVGMRPLYTILSMYVGFRLFGIPGFLLGPVGVLIGKELYTSCRQSLAT